LRLRHRDERISISRRIFLGSDKVFRIFRPENHYDESLTFIKEPDITMSYEYEIKIKVDPLDNGELFMLLSTEDMKKLRDTIDEMLAIPEKE
jgi:hypothetical protein